MSEGGVPSLEERLAGAQDRLRQLVRRHARGVLRFESVGDLAQGANCHALDSARQFEYRSEAEFHGWLAQVVRQHVAIRHRYWSALKRGSARLLRLTLGDASQTGDTRVPAPASPGPGVTTFAWKREQLTIVARALELLSEKDRQLVRWASEDVPLPEQAERMRTSYAAVQRAGVRAQERFRKTFALLSSPPP